MTTKVNPSSWTCLSKLIYGNITASKEYVKWSNDTAMSQKHNQPLSKVRKFLLVTSVQLNQLDIT